MNLSKITFPIAILAIVLTILANENKFVFHSAREHSTIFPHLNNIDLGIRYAIGESPQKIIHDTYETKIELSKSRNSVSTYVPKYNETAKHTASMYAGFFGMKQEFAETLDYYAFTNDRANLYVYKHKNLIRYEINPDYYFESDTLSIFTETDALNQAVKFIENNFLYLNYEESNIWYENGIYTVTLINNLEGLRNYAFPNRVCIDECGRILLLEYYFMTYENLDTVKTCSMYDAFYRLPTDIAVSETIGGKIFPYRSQNCYISIETPITINDCKLVYIYKNSILQPAYLFTGTTSDSNPFECFVDAVDYVGE